MAAAVVAEMILDARDPRRDLAAGRHLAVEHPQRVQLHAAHAVGAEPVHVLGQIAPQRLGEFGAAHRVAHAVHQGPHAGQPHRSEQVAQQRDHLEVGAGRIGAQQFRADLLMLAVAPGLRALVAEHGTDVVDLPRLRSRVEFVLHIGARHRSGPLRPQGQASSLAIGEGVHLLLHDVGGLPHAAQEEVGVLEDGGADLTEPIAGENVAEPLLDVLPRRATVGENVLGSAGRHHAHAFCVPFLGRAAPPQPVRRARLAPTPSVEQHAERRRRRHRRPNRRCCSCAPPFPETARPARPPSLPTRARVRSGGPCLPPPTCVPRLGPATRRGSRTPRSARPCRSRRGHREATAWKSTKA